MTRTIEKIILGILIIAIFGIGSFVIAGLGDETSSEVQKPSRGTQQISLEQAKTIALGVADGTISEAVLEMENEAWIYTIEITKGNLETDIKINPSTGSILNIETETEEEITVKDLDKIEGKITEERAKEIALNEVNGKIIKIDIEKENGKLLYEVEVKQGNNIAEVEINAETGEILEVEWEDDNEEED